MRQLATLGCLWLLVLLLCSPLTAEAQTPPLDQFLGLTKEKVSITWQDVGAASYQLHCLRDGVTVTQQTFQTIQEIDITTLIDAPGNWSCAVTAIDINGNTIDSDTRAFGVWESNPGVLELLFKVGP